jgi:hypothetical protein
LRANEHEFNLSYAPRISRAFAAKKFNVRSSTPIRGKNTFVTNVTGQKPLALTLPPSSSILLN